MRNQPSNCATKICVHNLPYRQTKTHILKKQISSSVTVCLVGVLNDKLWFAQPADTVLQYRWSLPLPPVLLISFSMQNFIAQGRVVNVSSNSRALKHLFTKIRDAKTPRVEFCTYANRLMTIIRLVTASTVLYGSYHAVECITMVCLLCTVL